MRILDRYIFRSVIATTLLALLAVVALDTLFIFVAEADKIGRGHYGLGTVLVYILWSLPQNAVAAMPAVFLLGGLLGLGALAVGSEIVVIRASGVSTLRIVWSALRPGIVLSLIALLLGEFVAPGLAHRASDMRAEALGKTQSIRGEKGFWAKDGSRVVWVRELRTSGELANIELYEFDDENRFKRFARVDGARHVKGGWQLDHVQSTWVDGPAARIETYASEPWRVSISPSLLEILSLDPDEISLRDLWSYLDYLDENGLDSRSHHLAWWQKLVAPFGNLVMLFIATPFVFGPLRQAAFGQRLFVGILIGLGFFLVNRAMGGFGLVYGLPPFIAAVLPTAMFFAAGALAFSRIR